MPKSRKRKGGYGDSVLREIERIEKIIERLRSSSKMTHVVYISKDCSEDIEKMKKRGFWI